MGKTYSDTRPQTLLPLGDGNWHYNFNIHNEPAPQIFKEEPREQYVYETVYIEGNPTIAKITAAMKNEGFSSAEIKAEKENMRTVIKKTPKPAKIDAK